MKKVTTDSLRLGDVVAISNFGKYTNASVIHINHDAQEVEIFRPYVHTANFEFTGGVIPYIGTERFKIPFNNAYEIWLVEKNTTPIR